MTHSTTLPEINDVNDCQLASFTNKLPYYVRRLCKSSNKNNVTATTSKLSEYYKKNYNISLFSRLNRLVFFE